MSKAVLCPVCQGSGKYTVPPDPVGTAASPFIKTCQGCGGKGWVEINE